MFKVQDETTGADLYFVFNGDQLNEIEDQSMLGERVEIDIVITDVEGGKVAYNVTDGPSLVDDGSDEESEE
ncbi:MAG: hypothetical protein QY318_03650 [Candidatus Dojkabacteria bacterium]|nr:MAG: hypothetical protein QY318_03650 [Candidatus Dojkabacteria bacterium]